MAIQFLGPGGLFPRVGGMFCVMQTINAATGSTIPDRVNLSLTEFDPESLEFKQIVGQLPQLTTQLPQTVAGVSQQCQIVAQNTIIQMVQDDDPQPQALIGSALPIVIEQMIDQGLTVQRTHVSASAGAPPGTLSTNRILVSVVRPVDGRQQEDLFAEVLTLTATGSNSYRCAGQPATAQPILAGWPTGSGSTATIPVSGVGGANMLANFSFESADDTGAPTGWIVDVGTIPTTVALTAIRALTLTIAGGPSSGTYLIQFTNGAGQVLTTPWLPYSADALAVQNALGSIAGLGSVQVVTTGTFPNVTHTITLVGVANAFTATVAAVNRMNAGTITPGVAVAGSAYPYASARALTLVGNGAELTTLLQPVTLGVATAYAFSIRVSVDVVPAAGVLTFDLFDGLDTVEDAAGVPNSVSVSLTGLTPGVQNLFVSAVWNTPPENLPTTIYLRMRASTAISSGSIVYLDAAAMNTMTRIYPGGPYAAIFGGDVAAQAGFDQFLIQTTSDRAGKIQEWFERSFAMRDKDLLLPSSDSPNVPNSLACADAPSSSSSSP